MNHIEDLKKGLRIAKNNLLKASKILLHELEATESWNEETQYDINLLIERIGYLEEEIWADINNGRGKNLGKERLENALSELKRQLVIEKELFDKGGSNADKLLDINFRVQEIEEALNNKCGKD